MHFHFRGEMLNLFDRRILTKNKVLSHNVQITALLISDGYLKL